MKKAFTVVFIFLVSISVIGCFEDQDDNLISASEINDFVWKGMNLFYVYKDNINDLANDRFSSNNEYAEYLNSFSTPEDLFESLIYLPDDVDEFSVIVPNYFELEQLLQGVSLNNGMEFGLVRYPSNPTNVFGYVRYVLPNTSAENEGVLRGMIFSKVDGQQLTESNFSSLLFGSNTSYTIGLATYNDNGTEDTSDDFITDGDQSITLTKEEYTENPILTSNVLEVGSDKIGYLMYNGFRIANSSITELNTVFGNFKSEGITDLVLDLRYNGGGTVDVAIWLSSMITGQFTGETFFEENWNADIQAVFENENPEALINPFVDEMIKRNSDGDVVFQQDINSLNLDRVYIITTRGTASASELVINGLDPFIEVIKIGTSTRGKPQASTTLYDSDNFGRANANPNHTYAMQPLIYEAANADGVSDYYDGLIPNTGLEQSENYGNLGVLGTVDEPLLALAIDNITGFGRSFNSTGFKTNLEELDMNRGKNSLKFEMFDQNIQNVITKLKATNTEASIIEQD